MQATRENLQQHAAPPLTQWLIDAAKRRSSLTYGEAKRRLEIDIDFDTIFSSMMGVPAGALMNRILHVRSDCPLLNILLVRQGDGMPGDGAGPFMADYLGRPELARDGYRDTHLQQWREACEEIATEVYAFGGWDQVYRQAFGQNLPAATPPEGTERDGISRARSGEGPSHRALRLWVQDNPGRIRRDYRHFDTDTEVLLDSAGPGRRRLLRSDHDRRP